LDDCVNYFSYFSEIEDTFIRRRGKHLMLSPMDWALIEGWKERGVPLHVVIRSIEHAFDSHAAKKHKRTVKTLLYCQEEVEAQYAEWLTSRVGTNEAPASADEVTESTPFPRAAVLAHLVRSREELTQRQADHGNEDEWGEVLSRALHLLTELEDDYATAATPDTRKLEDSLTGIDRLLSDTLQLTVSPEQLASIKAELAEQLEPYRTRMEKAIYQQTTENLLLKRLRDLSGIPRLSLFYLNLG
jgi:phage terminase Nu1 subunit (DNA packaging protein)